MLLNVKQKIVEKIPNQSYLNKGNVKLLLKQLTGKIRNNYNVVIISIDSLRRDHLSCYGYHRNTTPNINWLAQNGVIFKNAFSNSAWTAPGHMSLLTGRLPSNHGLIYNPDPGCIRDDIFTLGSILQNEGYLTRGFHGAGYLREKFGFHRGFHQYTTRGNNFEDNIIQCLKWLEKAKKFRFMLFLHGFNCHSPFNPPPEFDVYFREYKGNYSVKKLYQEFKLPANQDDIEHIIAKYDATILGADFVLGKIFNKLKELKILTRTIVVIVSDHGDGLGEHESFGHLTQLYNEVISIPMIIYGAGIFPAGKQIDELVSLIDIAPTITDALQVKREYQFDGQSLLPLINGQSFVDRVVFAETAITQKSIAERKKTGFPKRYLFPILRCMVTKKWKLIIDNNDKPFELYNMIDDKGEEVNLVETHSEVAERLLKQFFEQGPSKKAQELLPPKGNKGDFDENLKQQLQALGYF